MSSRHHQSCSPQALKINRMQHVFGTAVHCKARTLCYGGARCLAVGAKLHDWEREGEEGYVPKGKKRGGVKHGKHLT